MTLTQAATDILDQLATLARQIRDIDYARPSQTLNGATIGQHLRHTIEFFLCLQQGYPRGVVNYDKRSHDKLIETDKTVALAAIEGLYAFIAILPPAAPLTLEVNYDPKEDQFLSVRTNSTRELIYNLEHAIHHMAMIKIGVRELAPYVNLPAHFGIAPSTVRHLSQTATSGG